MHETLGYDPSPRLPYWLRFSFGIGISALVLLFLVGLGFVFNNLILPLITANVALVLVITALLVILGAIVANFL